jgi:hypothetical protein
MDNLITDNARQCKIMLADKMVARSLVPSVAPAQCKLHKL